MLGRDTDLDRAIEYLKARAPGSVDVALVLGSGLGGFAERLAARVAVPYGDVPGLPVSTVEGHAGQYVFGTRGALSVGVMQGRVHGYEGWTAREVVRPVRALLSLGPRVLIVTNASGAVSETVDAGDLVLIRDHLNLTSTNPLIGPNDPALGPRFPDLQGAYDEALTALARQAGEAAGVELREGVYACLPGPTYETPAEVRMLAVMGADIVGMSTVPEVIAARHMGVRVLGISCAANRAAGRPGAVLSHDDVQRVAAAVSGDFIRLIEGILDLLPAGGPPS
jgi:purine-nucleoside phosphorylase